MSEREWSISADDLSGADIRTLLELHIAGMAESSPEGSCHFLDIDALAVPDVTLWSIRHGGELAGCGALQELSVGHGEVKSMRTDPNHLGKGVGRRMLTHIVEQARQRGYERLSLETGSSLAFAAAIHLYESFRFEACEPFSDYEPDPFSRFYTLEL